MGKLSENNRLSYYISGLVDRKLKAVTLAITSSVGYLNTLVTRSQTSADTAKTEADKSAVSATSSATSLADTKARMREFFATYLGVNTSDPSKSSLGDDVRDSAFSIRKSDGRLRYALRNSQGVLTWQDATVAADPQSVRDIGFPLFLVLDRTEAQRVKGPVSFDNVTSVADLTDWTRTAPPRATNVKKLVDDSILDLATKTVTGGGLATQSGDGELRDNVVITVAKSSVSALQAGTEDTSVPTPQQLKAAGFVYVKDSGSNVNGYYRVWSDGLKECWGSINVPPNATVTVTLPVTHDTYCIPTGSIRIEQDESSIGVLNPTAAEFQIKNTNPKGGIFYWHTKGV